MASGHTLQDKLQTRKQFQRALQILLDTFYDTILLYTQDIHVVNFSDIARGLVNVIIMYKTAEGQSVKLEALGEIDDTYIHTLILFGKQCREQPKRLQVIIQVLLHH